jgi:DNA-binding MarR family transcriptional regulator
MAGECYCAALRKATRRVTALYDVALQPIGVNLAQFSLLRTIARVAPVSLTELGRLTELDRSTIGRNVRLLRGKGLVQVERGAGQREATVVLDEPGSEILRRGAPLWDGAQRKIEASLGPVAVHLRALLQAL